MIENIELTELKEDKLEKENILTHKDLAFCGHLKTSAQVVLAEVELSLDELFALKKGSLLETKQSIDSPAILILNGKSIATGRLVISGDQFGFEVTDISNN